jgi:hypothetical protein
MSNQSEENTRFVTCPCQHCGGHIEFDASDFAKYEGRKAECPHCHLETIIYVPPQGITPKATSAQSVGNVPDAEKSSSAWPSSSRIELFFYKTGNTEKGPYTFEQLRSLWNNGQITGDALYRSEQSSEWDKLSVRIEQAIPHSFPALTKLHNLVLTGIFVFSLVAVFLPNAVISVPIYGTIEISMFDFLTPKSDNPAVAKAAPNKPYIGDVIDSKGFQMNKENIGAIICALSVFGLLLHYLLTLVWGVMAFFLKRTFSALNILWLFLALQFPILFSMGAHLLVAALKTSALSNAVNDGDNSPGATLGTALGAAFINHIFLQPGAAMWVLMAFALLGICLPRLAWWFNPPWIDTTSLVRHTFCMAFLTSLIKVNGLSLSCVRFVLEPLAFIYQEIAMV